MGTKREMNNGSQAHRQQGTPVFWPLQMRFVGQTADLAGELLRKSCKIRYTSRVWRADH